MRKIDFKNLNILLVDDYGPMLNILSKILREFGIQKLEMARSGEEALQKMDEKTPDIVITDAVMKPINGMQLTKKIRDGSAGVDPFLPVIMISGRTEIQTIAAARDMGVTEFLAKPVSAKLVYLRLCSVVENPREFVRTESFFGPDRRRRQLQVSGGDRRATKHDYRAQTRAQERA